MGIAAAARTPQKLTEKIYELLKKDIIECKLEPGELLQETTVQDRYRIGHTPFREACHRLEAEGLVQILPHRGYFVSSFSNKNIRDLFELRMTIEPKAAELACQRSGLDQWNDLEKNLLELSRLTEIETLTFIEDINWNNRDFHLQVAKLADNQLLEGVIENIHNKLMRIIMFTARRTPENQLFNPLHAMIFEAIKQRKAADARRWMIKDVVIAREWIREFGR